MAVMSENHAETQTTPPATDEPCADCATNGEKLLAVLAGLFAAFIIVMAVDMFTGGKVSGVVRQRVTSDQPV